MLIPLNLEFVSDMHASLWDPQAETLIIETAVLILTDMCEQTWENCTVALLGPFHADLRSVEGGRSTFNVHLWFPKTPPWRISTA